MKEVEIEKCPFCGGTEFIDTMLMSYGGTAFYVSLTRNATAFATVCRDCGSVVRMYTKTPEKLYPKKERRQ